MNSRQYEWADVTVIVGGHDLTGIRGIEYKQTIEREVVYGKGRKGHSIQSGNLAVDGTITVLQSELLALQQAGNGSILNLNVDVLVSYGNPPSAIVTDRVIGVRFTEEPKSLQQNDKFMEISLPFIALDLETNV